MNVALFQNLKTDDKNILYELPEPKFLCKQSFFLIKYYLYIFKVFIHSILINHIFGGTEQKFCDANALICFNNIID